MKHKIFNNNLLFFRIPLTITGLVFCLLCGAQQPKIVKKEKIYKQQVAKDSLYCMVELKSLMPALMYDLRYATTHNFTHTQLYKKGNATFTRLPVAKALATIEEILKKQGLGLKIFDAYRPYAITKKMWDLVHDERYVANPAKGSGHNRGLAVDVTLIDLKTGQELLMGTGFDNFTDSAHHSFTALPPQILQNRMLLQQVMEHGGFKKLETEWWHYAWPNDHDYDVLDIDFKKLKKVSCNK